MKIPDFKKILRKTSFKRRPQYRTIGEKANHDWKYMVFSFVFFACIIIASGLYMFVKVSKGELFSIETQSKDTLQTIQTKDLDMVIKFFDEKNTRLEKAKNKDIAVPDPSL